MESKWSLFYQKVGRATGLILIFSFLLVLASILCLFAPAYEWAEVAMVSPAFAFALGGEVKPTPSAGDYTVVGWTNETPAPMALAGFICIAVGLCLIIAFYVINLFRKKWGIVFGFVAFACLMAGGLLNLCCLSNVALTCDNLGPMISVMDVSEQLQYGWYSLGLGFILCGAFSLAASAFVLTASALPFLKD